jgi:hypothetical protein
MNVRDVCSVYFKYKCKGINYNSVGLVGCLNILNNWNIDNKKSTNRI